MTMTSQEYKAYTEHQRKTAQQKNKYKNTRVEVDGIKFDSKKESEYYQRLKILKQRGLIKAFERQVRYKLEVNGTLVCTYVADFFIHYEDGRHRVIDVKSDFTRKLPAYRIKKKLMFAIYGITIEEV